MNWEFDIQDESVIRGCRHVVSWPRWLVCPTTMPSGYWMFPGRRDDDVLGIPPVNCWSSSSSTTLYIEFWSLTGSRRLWTEVLCRETLCCTIFAVSSIVELFCSYTPFVEFVPVSQMCLVLVWHWLSRFVTLINFVAVNSFFLLKP